MLIALLLPALSRARQQAMQIQCLSNERQVGLNLLQYSNMWNGYLFPPGMGARTGDIAPEYHNVWPYIVFGEDSPAVMRCPNDPEPNFQHSYILNEHLKDHNIKYWSTMSALNNLSPSQIILMGEKVSTENDYYMETGDYDKMVEKYRHGLNVGSNYLMLDMHASTLLPGQAMGELDPWDLTPQAPTQ